MDKLIEILTEVLIKLKLISPGFWGKITLSFEDGKLIHLVRKEETIKL